MSNPDACKDFLPPAGGAPPEAGGTEPVDGFEGPGGCKTKEECIAYCQKDPRQCAGFTVPGDDSTNALIETELEKYRALYESGQTQPPPPLPSMPAPTEQYPVYLEAPAGGTSYEIPITPELCAKFSAAPSCSYVGAPDTQYYQLCKKCYPDR